MKGAKNLFCFFGSISLSKLSTIFFYSYTQSGGTPGASQLCTPEVWRTSSRLTPSFYALTSITSTGRWRFVSCAPWGIEASGWTVSTACSPSTNTIWRCVNMCITHKTCLWYIMWCVNMLIALKHARALWKHGFVMHGCQHSCDLLLGELTLSDSCCQHKTLNAMYHWLIPEFYFVSLSPPVFSSPPLSLFATKTLFLILSGLWLC